MGSRSKEAYVVCVDVGEHTKNSKHCVAQAVSNLAVSHVMHMPSWYLSIVTFGSSITNNPEFTGVSVGTEGCQYENINVITELSPPSMEQVNTAKTISSEVSVSGCSNFLEVLFVACQIFTQQEVDSKIVKKIVLISNFADKIKAVTGDYFGQLRQMLYDMDICLDIICLDYLQAQSAFKQTNMEVLGKLKERVKYGSITNIAQPHELQTVFKAITIAPLNRGNSGSLLEEALEEYCQKFPEGRMDCFFVAPVCTQIQHIPANQLPLFTDLKQSIDIQLLQRPKEGEHQTFAFVQDKTGSWGLQILAAQSVKMDLVLTQSNIYKQIKEQNCDNFKTDEDLGDEGDDVGPQNLFINEIDVIQDDVGTKRKRQFNDQSLVSSKRRNLKTCYFKLVQKQYLKKLINGLSMDHFVFLPIHANILRPEVQPPQFWTDDEVDNLDFTNQDYNEFKYFFSQSHQIHTPPVFYDPKPPPRRSSYQSTEKDVNSQQQQQQNQDQEKQQSYVNNQQIQQQINGNQQNSNVQIKSCSQDGASVVDAGGSQNQESNGNIVCENQKEDELQSLFSDDSEDWDSEIELETQEGKAHQAVIPPLVPSQRRQLSYKNVPSLELELLGELICERGSNKAPKKKESQCMDSREIGMKLGLGFMGPIVGRDWDLQDKWLFCQGLSEMGKRDFNTLQKNYLQHKDSNQLVSYYYNVWKIEKYNYEIQTVL